MRKILITGGAGFIGCNAAAAFSKDGWQVTVIDNLSRKGAELNKEWLEKSYSVCFIKVDVRNYLSIKQLMLEIQPEVILHLAGQVAVTTSVENPREDFEINALGTFNLLESARLLDTKPLVIYSSTNKVYGGMEDVVVLQENQRYCYRDFPDGMSESRQLDFHSPYGCSKGAADQYVHDYFRIFDLPSVVLRQSCIYGKRQFGVEDQGWVAWFTIASTFGKSITIYGDGMQVRDILYINDLLDVYRLCIHKRELAVGKIFNIGGGPRFTLSLLELIQMLEDSQGRKINFDFSNWRQGDQRVYVSNISHVREVLGWEPKITPKEGIVNLHNWIIENANLFESFQV